MAVLMLLNSNLVGTMLGIQEKNVPELFVAAREGRMFYSVQTGMPLHSSVSAVEKEILLWVTIATILSRGMNSRLEHHGLVNTCLSTDVLRLQLNFLA